MLPTGGILHLTLLTAGEERTLTSSDPFTVGAFLAEATPLGEEDEVTLTYTLTEEEEVEGFLSLLIAEEMADVTVDGEDRDLPVPGADV